MERSYWLPTRSLTGDQVFAVLKSDVLQTWWRADEQSQPSFRPGDPLTALFEAYSAFDGPDPLSVICQCESVFGIRIRNREWAKLLEPNNRLTICDFCEFIATKASTVKIEPVTVFGRPCLNAGAFLAIRELLERAGAEVAELAPSTSLAPYLARWTRVFLWDIAKLAPGRLPLLRFEIHPVVRHCFGHMTLSLFLFGLFFLLSFLWQIGQNLMIHQLIAAGFCFAAAHVLSLTRCPTRVEMDDVHTFRDLCYALTADTSSLPRAAHEPA